MKAPVKTGAFALLGGIHFELCQQDIGQARERSLMTTMLKTKLPRAEVMRESWLRHLLGQLELISRAWHSECPGTKIQSAWDTWVNWLKEAIAKKLGIATWEVGI